VKLFLQKTSSTLCTLLFLIVPTILSVGCTSVDPAPFTQFATSLQPLRDAVDAHAGTAAETSRQELVRKVAEGEISAADLQLEFESSSHFTAGYGFAVDGEPNFARFERFRLGLSTLNDAMIVYAQSLAILAGGGQGGDILPSATGFDQMARDLNSNASTAATALGLNADPGKQALLSSVAIQLFKTYIENRRRKDLVRAINEVQPRVEDFSSSAQQAVQFLASLVETDYNRKILKLLTTSPANTSAILSFNDTTQATLNALRSMYNSYGALPAAHRNLLAAADRKSTGLAGLIALGEETTRLQGLVTQLSKANAASN
jgi:hypothetical protein